MASQGYHLTSIFLGYRFKKGEPETATIRKDFRRFENKEDFLDYQALFEDSGWKHLAGTKNSGDQYFKKIDEGVIDDIVSDKMCFELAVAFIPVLVVFFIADIIDFNAFVNPKALYLTQDLWDKTGSAFWSAFLFETPFALMRGIIWLFIPLMIIFYLYFGYQSHRLYLKNKN